MNNLVKAQKLRIGYTLQSFFCFLRYGVLHFSSLCTAVFRRLSVCNTAQSMVCSDSLYLACGMTVQCPPAFHVVAWQLSMHPLPLPSLFCFLRYAVLHFSRLFLYFCLESSIFFYRLSSWVLFALCCVLLKCAYRCVYFRCRSAG